MDEQKRGNMDTKKLIILIILPFLIPSVIARNYGEGKYGYGLYGIGEEIIEEIKEVTGAGESASAGARGGGCDVYADQYQRCFYVNENQECQEGCLEWYTCNKNYRCILMEHKKLITDYYYIYVDVLNNIYQQNNNVIANITIISKETDINGTLISYLESPNGTIYKYEELTFDLIPLACQNGIFFEEVCLSNATTNDINKTIITMRNDLSINSTPGEWEFSCPEDKYREYICVNDTTIYEPIKIIRTREMALPINTYIGEWKFKVLYASKIQPQIEIYDRFEVNSKRGLFFVISIISIILFYVIYKVRKKKKPKVTKQEEQKQKINNEAWRI